MITREELESVATIKRRIQYYQNQQQKRDTAHAIRYDLERVQSSGRTGSETEDIAIYRAEIDDKINHLKATLWKRYNDIFDFVEQIPAQKEKEIIELRCLEGFTFDEIGSVLHMHRTTVYRKYENILAEYGVK